MLGKNASTSWATRSDTVQSEWPLVSEREPVQEEYAAVQDEGWQPAGARQPRSVGRSARYAETGLCSVGRTTSASGHADPHSAVLTDTSMNACATSSPDDTRWQDAVLTDSLAQSSMENSVCCVSNACP